MAKLSDKSLESFNKPSNIIELKYNNSVTGNPIIKPLDFMEQNKFLFHQKVKQLDRYNTEKDVLVFGLKPNTDASQNDYETKIQLAMATCYMFHYHSPIIRTNLFDRINETISILELKEGIIDVSFYTDPLIVANKQFCEPYNMMRRIFILQNWYAEEFRTTLEFMERTLDMAFYRLLDGSITEEAISAMLKIKESKLKHYEAVLRAIADSKTLWKFSSSLLMENPEEDNVREIEQESNFDNQT